MSEAKELDIRCCGSGAARGGTSQEVLSCEALVKLQCPTYRQSDDEMRIEEIAGHAEVKRRGKAKGGQKGIVDPGISDT